MQIGIPTFGADGGLSGTSQHLIELLHELGRIAHAAAFELLTYREEQKLFQPEAGSFKVHAADPRMRSPFYNTAWYIVDLGRWAKAQHHDVLLLPAGNRRLPFYAPCPTVGIVHDFSCQYIEGRTDRLRLFFIRHVIPRLVRRLTHVITPSESTKRDILKFAAIPQDRLTVIPNGIRADRFTPGDKSEAFNDVAARYGFHRPYLLCISRIGDPDKNLLRLIRAFDRLKVRHHIPHQLVLVGGEGPGSVAVRAAVTSISHSDHVTFTGFIPSEELPNLYRAADIFVFPSLHEGFAGPVLEAMACETPVACSNVSSMPEVAGAAANLFDPTDEEAIAQSVLRLLKNQPYREERVTQGLQRSKGFTWRTTAEKTLAVLHQAAEKKRPPP